MEQQQIKKNQETALLVMDVQENLLEKCERKQELLQSLSKAIGKARSANIPIIYVTLVFRKGYPEISQKNKFFYMVKEAGTSFIDLQQAAKFDPSIPPKEGDIIVNKLRGSAFAGTDLEVILKNLNVQHLVLTGFETSGVILSTVRQAADMDYGLTVLKDCCVDREDDMGVFIMERILPRQADIIEVNQWNITETGTGK
mgnify:CR=1 FL=1